MQQVRDVESLLYNRLAPTGSRANGFQLIYQVSYRWACRARRCYLSSFCFYSFNFRLDLVPTRLSLKLGTYSATQVYPPQNRTVPSTASSTRNKIYLPSRITFHISIPHKTRKKRASVLGNVSASLPIYFSPRSSPVSHRSVSRLTCNPHPDTYSRYIVQPCFSPGHVLARRDPTPRLFSDRHRQIRAVTGHRHLAGLYLKVGTTHMTSAENPGTKVVDMT